MTELNHLRFHRKKSELFLGDIAFLLDTSDISLVSRYEKGRRSPSMQFLLFYHLLFDAPVEAFFERQRREARALLGERIPVLIENLLASPQHPHTGHRIAFLSEAHKRLTAPQL